MRTARTAVVILLSLALLAACDSAGGSRHPVSGTVTFTVEEGVDFYSGAVVGKANYKNADLIATQSGGGLKLATGGPSPVESRPVDWFLSAGGIHRTFASLADVPSTTPDDTMTSALVKAKTGNGFVAMGHGGDWVRGWIAAADTESVTIQFEPLVLEE